MDDSLRSEQPIPSEVLLRGSPVFDARSVVRGACLALIATGGGWWLWLLLVAMTFVVATQVARGTWSGSSARSYSLAASATSARILFSSVYERLDGRVGSQAGRDATGRFVNDAWQSALREANERVEIAFQEAVVEPTQE